MSLPSANYKRSIGFDYPNAGEQQDYDIDENLVLYLKLDEPSGTPTDSSIYSHTCGVTGTSIVTGKINNGREFSGSTHKIVVSNDTVLQPRDFITLECWCKPDVASGYLIEKGSSYRLAINGSGQPYFSIWDGTSTQRTATSSVALPVGVWSHVAGTYDGKYVRIFVNGVEQNKLSQVGTIRAVSTNIRIGQDGGNSNNFDGVLDECKVYRKAKRSFFPLRFNNYPITVPLTDDSTTSGDYQFYDDCETGSASDNWNFESGSGSFSYSTDYSKNGTQSLKVVPSTSPYVIKSDSFTQPSARGCIKMWFFDENPTDSEYKLADVRTGSSQINVLLGIKNSTSVTHYVYYNSGWQTTGMKRKYGWRLFEFKWLGGTSWEYYIDGKYVGSATATGSSWDTLFFLGYNGDTMYIDDIKVSNGLYAPQEKISSNQRDDGYDCRIVGYGSSWTEGDYDLMEGSKDVADSTALSTRGWSYVLYANGTPAYSSDKGNEIHKYVKMATTNTNGIAMVNSFTGQTGTVEYKFYDYANLASTEQFYYLYVASSGTAIARLGIQGRTSILNYCYRTSSGSWTDTGIKRTKGMHTIKYVHTGTSMYVYLDNKFVYKESMGSYPTFNELRFYYAGAILPGTDTYWTVRVCDDVNGMLPIAQEEIPSQLVYQDAEFFDNAEGEINDITIIGKNGWTSVAGSNTYRVYNNDTCYSGTKSIKLDSTTPSAQQSARKTVSSNKVVLKFYDDDASSKYASAWVSTQSKGLGVDTGTDGDNYCYYDGGWVATSVARTDGWHEFKFVCDGTDTKGYIDGTLVRTFSGVSSLTNFDILDGDTGKFGTSYWDEIRVYDGDDKPTGLMFLGENTYQKVLTMENDEFTQALWKFENDWTDDSDNGYDLTNNGGSFSGTSRVGSYSASFGAGDYATASSLNIFNSSQEQGSVEAVFQTGSNITAEQWIYSIRELSPAIKAIRMYVTGGILQVNIYNSSNKTVETPSGFLAIDTWYFATFNWHKGADGNYIYELHVNGVLMDKESAGVGIPDPASTYLWIGNNNENSSTQYFRGLIDEIRISNVVRRPMGFDNTYELYYGSLTTPAKYNCPYELTWSTGATQLTVETPIHKAVLGDGGAVEGYFFKGGSDWLNYLAGSMLWNVADSGTTYFSSNAAVSGLQGLKVDSGAIMLGVRHDNGSHSMWHNLYGGNSFIDGEYKLVTTNEHRIAFLGSGSLAGDSGQHYSWHGESTAEVSSNTYYTDSRGFVGGRSNSGNQYVSQLVNEEDENNLDQGRIEPASANWSAGNPLLSGTSGDNYNTKTSMYKFRIGVSDGYI